MNLEIFLLSFIPLFVAIDIIGVTPLFIGYIEGLDKANRKKLLRDAIITAFIVAVAFLLAGKLVLNFLGITIDDFKIGGGIILLVLAITDIMTSGERRRDPGNSIGVVPLGIPLIMGPAGLTTIIMLVNNFGYLATILSIVLNFIIVWLTLINANLFIKVIGEGGAKAFAKIASLFMAAIAVMMIRVGIIGIINTFNK
ncbi:MAG: MarC family protein [Ignavibacteriales bacterium CG_4_9_14_3_um_filter_30_11]|nr:MAG: MarC family protein [Ignavibacteriales bacterium CG_4_9_14_3_um_filter_30_11]